MEPTSTIKSLHGVLVSFANKGILIIGKAGVGKSSFALELLYNGFQLIADDNVEITLHQQQIIGSCPKLVEKLLHTRELGLIDVTTLFGQVCWQSKHTIDYVVQIQTDHDNHSSIASNNQTYTVENVALPLLILNTQTPISLYHRLDCWLRTQNQQNHTKLEFIKRHQKLMAS